MLVGTVYKTLVFYSLHTSPPLFLSKMSTTVPIVKSPVPAGAIVGAAFAATFAFALIAFTLFRIWKARKPDDHGSTGSIICNVEKGNPIEVFPRPPEVLQYWEARRPPPLLEHNADGKAR
jgi:hypothetical protein